MALGGIIELAFGECGGGAGPGDRHQAAHGSVDMSTEEECRWLCADPGRWFGWYALTNWAMRVCL